jgi:hypothetical protein
MKNYLTIIALTLAVQVYGQSFVLHHEIEIPDTLTVVAADWVDLDNDGLLDLALLSSTTVHHYLMVVRGDTVQPMKLQTAVTSIYTADAFHVCDYDKDNQMDVIVSGVGADGPKTVLYKNTGSFAFQEEALPVDAFAVSAFADLDNDARPEWIISGASAGKGYTKILKEGNGGWRVVHDSLQIALSAIEVIDSNSDGFTDLFISGRVSTDSVFSSLLINHGRFFFTSELNMNWIGRSSVADINYDGVFDIIFSGHDNDGNRLTKS